RSVRKKYPRAITRMMFAEGSRSHVASPRNEGVLRRGLFMGLLTAWRYRFVVASAIAITLCAPAAAQEQPRGLYTPAAADSVHAIAAEHGMVVAQEKTAARIGTDILKRGGNAVDAAVATGFAMAVTYPRAGNIGGGGFMVIHSAERREDIAIDY